MIPIEKVQSIIDTYEALEKDLASGNIDKRILLKNQKNILKLAKL